MEIHYFSYEFISFYSKYHSTLFRQINKFSRKDLNNIIFSLEYVRLSFKSHWKNLSNGFPFEITNFWKNTVFCKFEIFFIFFPKNLECLQFFNFHTHVLQNRMTNIVLSLKVNIHITAHITSEKNIITTGHEHRQGV